MSRRLLVAAVFLASLAHQNAWAAEPVALSARVQGYLNALLLGKKAAILKNEDFYDEIHLVSDAKITNLQKLPDGGYQVEIRFQTTQLIEQSLGEKGPSIRKKADRRAISKTLRFKVLPTYLNWTQQLNSPFVKAGHEGRYLLKKNSN